MHTFLLPTIIFHKHFLIVLKHVEELLAPVNNI